MANARQTLWFPVILAVGCSPGGAALESTWQGLDICAEAVPANRQVDGIPAYSQCAAAENSPIYSNNGVDTATTSGGTGWIRTQYNGGYQCTELAHRYLTFKWKVSWIPNGNAGLWCDTPPPASSGLVQTTTPVHGDLIVFAPGVCGASADTGHVAVVDVVDTAKSQVTLVEQNRAGRRNSAFSCAKCYLHVVANTGATPEGDGGLPGDAAAGVDARNERDARVLAGTGGIAATGGRGAATGGTTATGGRGAATGGTAATGGILSTGGAWSATGGDPAGGTPGSGGVAATGGDAVVGDPITVNKSNGGGCALTATGRTRSGSFLAWLGLGLLLRRRRGPGPHSW